FVTGLVVVFSVVVVLVCAKAKGAIAAQARMRMLFFIMFPSMLILYWFRFVSKPSAGRLPLQRCRSSLDRERRGGIHRNFYLANARKMFRELSAAPHS